VRKCKSRWRRTFSHEKGRDDYRYAQLDEHGKDREVGTPDAKRRRRTETEDDEEEEEVLEGVPKAGRECRRNFSRPPVLMRQLTLPAEGQ